MKRAMCLYQNLRISIHTSVWEVTFSTQKEVIMGVQISIHTSVWEVTYIVLKFQMKSLNFNPHLRMGGDVIFFN